jgi:hypothetical protein
LYSFNSFYNVYDQNSWGDADDILYVKIVHDDGTIERHKFPAPGADAQLNQYSTPPEDASPQVASNSVDQNSLPSNISIPLDTQKDAIIPSKAISGEVLDIVESNNENVEMDLVRDKKIGIQALTKGKLRTKNDEKAYVEKIRKYEQEDAKRIEAEGRAISHASVKAASAKKKA